MPLASARKHPENLTENQKENQAGHSSERAVEGHQVDGRIYNNRQVLIIFALGEYTGWSLWSGVDGGRRADGGVQYDPLRKCAARETFAAAREAARESPGASATESNESRDYGGCAPASPAFGHSRPSNLVVNATTSNLVVMGSIPKWVTTSVKRTLRSRVQCPGRLTRA